MAVSYTHLDVYKRQVVHLLIREGDRNVALDYFADDLEFFNLTRKNINSGNASSNEVRALERYNNYLKVRCQEYGKIRKDYVQEGYSSLKLNNARDTRAINRAMDHVDSLETQIAALLKNKYTQFDLNNELILYGFKLLVQDLLALYNALNEGVITCLLYTSRCV